MDDGDARSVDGPYLSIEVLDLGMEVASMECPEECREVVASLMFAAARFSDLPELRDLRDIFQERYESSLESFVNQKFVDKLATKPPTMEKKLWLLQDIASEFSIKWEPMGFAERMAAPPGLAQDKSKKYGSFHVTVDGNKLSKADKQDILSRKKSEFVDDGGHGIRSGREGNILRRDGSDIKRIGRQEFIGNGHKPVPSEGHIIPNGNNNDLSRRRREPLGDQHGSWNEKDDTTLKVVRLGSSSHGKKPECVGGGSLLQNDKVNVVSKGERKDPYSRGKSEVAAAYAGLSVTNDGRDVSSLSRQNVANPTRKVQEEETDRPKTYKSALPPPYVKSKDNAIPPPYFKPKDSKREASGGSKLVDSDRDGYSIDTSPHNRGNAVNSSESIHKVDHPGHEGQGLRPGRLNSHVHEKDHHDEDDKLLLKPRSTRRKHSKSSSSHNDVCSSEDTGLPKSSSSSSRRRDHSGKGLQILFDDQHYQKDAEERMIDKLLLRYSKKPSTHDEGKLRKKFQAHPSHQIAAYACESSYSQSREGHGVKSEMVPPPSRSVSLPREKTVPSGATKIFTHANSFHPDKQAPHVHPKLPDYDDLAARFAALRGR
ncbi:unnamed protein product [Ilex paraguariensis]|uniref:Regulator of Vps4 activity in the MVB pathway protein n=1 Tax=Ilex paraguariensis TaxID=185542 RepID=A0ABC8TUC1_9AQUA